MADSLHTISTLVADVLDLADKQVSDLSNAAPFVARLEAEESSNGTTHKYPVEDGAPVVGFRAENAGRDFSKSSDRIETINLKILDASWAVDKAVADAWRKGGAEAFIAREGFRHVRSALSMYEKQSFYGADNSASGFVGMADVLDDLSDNMVVDAGASSTGDLTSVYAIRLGDDDVKGVYKGDGPIVEMGDTTVIDMTDGSGKHFPAYYTPSSIWVGLTVGSIFSFGRLANVGSSDGKVTDDLIAELLERFPGDRQPNLLAMNRRSLFQLRASRTATNATGAPAPIPTEAFGIEIVSTDSLLNTESSVN